MQKQLDNIEKKVDTMYDGFIGNQFQEGLISEVKKNSAHRKKSARTNGIIGGAALAFGALIGKFWDSVASVIS